MRQGRWSCYDKLLILCAASIPFLLSSCGMTKTQQPANCPFTITLAKAADSVACAVTRNIYRIEIRSASGIGSATLLFGETDASQTIELIMHTKGLEQLTISDGQHTLETAYSSTAGSVQIPRTYMSIRGQSAKELRSDHVNYLPLKVAGAETANIDIPLKNGYFSLIIPSSFQNNADSLKISWIDFYR